MGWGEVREGPRGGGQGGGSPALVWEKPPLAAVGAGKQRRGSHLLRGPALCGPAGWRWGGGAQLSGSGAYRLPQEPRREEVRRELGRSCLEGRCPFAAGGWEWGGQVQRSLPDGCGGTSLGVNQEEAGRAGAVSCRTCGRPWHGGMSRVTDEVTGRERGLNGDWGLRPRGPGVGGVGGGGARGRGTGSLWAEGGRTGGSALPEALSDSVR